MYDTLREYKAQPSFASSTGQVIERSMDRGEKRGCAQAKREQKDRKDGFHGNFKGIRSINSCFQKPATGDATASLVLLLSHGIRGSPGSFRFPMCSRFGASCQEITPSRSSSSRSWDRPWPPSS